MKRVGLIIGIALLLLLGALAYALLPTHTRVITRAAPADAASIERGRYLAVIGDCTACHTAPGGQPFAGGLPLGSPVGTIYSTNITPDKKRASAPTRWMISIARCATASIRKAAACIRPCPIPPMQA